MMDMIMEVSFWREWVLYDDDGLCGIRDDAPEDAKAEFEKWCEQKRKRGIDLFRDGCPDLFEKNVTVLFKDGRKLSGRWTDVLCDRDFVNGKRYDKSVFVIELESGDRVEIDASEIKNIVEA